MIAAIYARKSTDQNIADEENSPMSAHLGDKRRKPPGRKREPETGMTVTLRRSNCTDEEYAAAWAKVFEILLGPRPHEQKKAPSDTGGPT